MTPHWFKIYKSKPRKKSKYSLVLHLQMGRRWGHSTTHKKITFSTQIELIKNVLKNLIVLSSKLQHQIEIFLSPKLIDIILSPVYSESIKFSLLYPNKLKLFYLHISLVFIKFHHNFPKNLGTMQRHNTKLKSF